MLYRYFTEKNCLNTDILRKLFIKQKNINISRIHFFFFFYQLRISIYSLSISSKVGWLYWVLTLRSYHGGRCRTCVSWLCHTSTNTTIFPRPPTTFPFLTSLRGERRKYTRKKVRLNRVSNSQPPGL